MDKDIPVCPICGVIIEEVWDNNGFAPPDPTHWEVVGYKCPTHGDVEPAEPEPEVPEEE